MLLKYVLSRVNRPLIDYSMFKKGLIMSEFKILEFITNHTLRDLFLKGHLIQEWSIMYPMIFDDDDKRTALS